MEPHLQRAETLRDHVTELAALVAAHIPWPPPDDIAVWLSLVIGLLDAGRQGSITLAEDYYGNERDLWVPDEPWHPAPPPVWDPVASAALITAAGPGLLRRPPDYITDPDAAARAAVVAEAQKTVADAARHSIEDQVAADRKAIGWARVTTGPSSCAFCRLLASRGPVYKSQGSAAGRRGTYHRRCDCTARPVFARDHGWDPQAAADRDLYRRKARGTDDPLNAFRRAVYDEHKDAINAQRRARRAEKKAAGERNATPAAGGVVG